ncbi:MAG: S-methyl-5-thioribose-1-phosphate isomerase [Patescibacteria group bacterium]|nr:S-methyl-5-thioribose-1-phosphate isomerase [Patescibacteria group bacterium]
MIERCMEWINNRVKFLDQTRLPNEIYFIETDDVNVIAEAIRTLRVRGAPALGVAGAYGAVLGALKLPDNPEDFYPAFQRIVQHLADTRPTAKNLFWALERIKNTAETLKNVSGEERRKRLIDEAVKIHQEDDLLTRQIGHNGAQLLRDGSTVMTYCNAGFLATGGIGTALGVIYSAVDEGKKISVYACETRPLLQGARLTSWELHQRGIPVTLICDNMAGVVLRRGVIDAIFVGADRITANGDTANKIGTYSLAINARHHGVPFYVAAPFTTFDLNLISGEQIPIEERNHSEISEFQGRKIAPEGINYFNPAFDVTPHSLISGIVTEKGIFTPPYGNWKK